MEMSFKVQIQDTDGNPILINNEIWPYKVDWSSDQSIERIPYVILMILQTLYFPGEYKYDGEQEISEQLNLYP